MHHPWLRPYRLLAASLLAFTGTSHAAVDTSYTLQPNEWNQLVIPAVLPIGEDTLGAMFGDEMSGLVHNVDWVAYTFEQDLADYKLLALDDRLTPGRGFWLLQLSDDSIELQLPDSAGPVVGSPIGGCLAGESCTTVALANAWPAGKPGWAMVGKPSLEQVMADDLRVATDFGPVCSFYFESSCSLDQSEAASLTAAVLYAWNPAANDGTGEYAVLQGTDPLPDWAGAWISSTDRALAEPVGPEEAPPRPDFQRFMSIPVAAPPESVACGCQFLEGYDLSGLFQPPFLITDFNALTGELDYAELQFDAPTNDAFDRVTVAELFNDPTVSDSELEEEFGIPASTPINSVYFLTQHYPGPSSGFRYCQQGFTVSEADLGVPEPDPFSSQSYASQQDNHGVTGLTQYPHNACLTDLHAISELFVSDF